LLENLFVVKAPESFEEYLLETIDHILGEIVKLTVSAKFYAVIIIIFELHVLVTYLKTNQF